MDFIKVTLREGIGSNKKISDLKTLENYLLPLHAIKTVEISFGGEYTHSVTILKDYLPDDLNFEVAFGLVNLPNGFINVVSQPKR